jgi:hypothetical protein
MDSEELSHTGTITGQTDVVSRKTEEVLGRQSRRLSYKVHAPKEIETESEAPSKAKKSEKESCCLLL